MTGYIMDTLYHRVAQTLSYGGSDVARYRQSCDWQDCITRLPSWPGRRGALRGTAGHGSAPDNARSGSRGDYPAQPGPRPQLSRYSTAVWSRAEREALWPGAARPRP